MFSVSTYGNSVVVCDKGVGPFVLHCVFVLVLSFVMFVCLLRMSRFGVSHGVIIYK